jgi:hypothetical protein
MVVCGTIHYCIVEMGAFLRKLRTYIIHLFASHLISSVNDFANAICISDVTH